MLIVLFALVTIAVFAAGPAHWTWIESAFRIVCHQQPDRTLSFAGSPMPVCARCAGLYTGAFLALLLRIPDRRRYLLLAAGIMAVDWTSEAIGLRPASAALRLSSGLLFGLAAAPVFATAVREFRPGGAR